MIETLRITTDSSLDAYPALRDEAGRFWDWDDDSWKDDVDDVVQPGPTSVDEVVIPGRGKSQYSATVDLAALNSKLDALAVFVDWREQVGASADLEADTALSADADPPMLVAAGRIQPEIRVQIVPCYDPEGGSGTGRGYWGVSVTANGEKVDLHAIDATADCALTIVAQDGSGTDLTVSATAPNSEGWFDLHIDDPTLVDNRNYFARAVITLASGATLEGFEAFPVAG